MKKNIIESWLTTVIGVIIIGLSCYSYFFTDKVNLGAFISLVVLGLVCVFVYEKGLKMLFNKVFKLK